MSHQLTIEVADEVYQPLLQRAQAKGSSPESVAADLVAEGLHRIEPGYFLRKWAGALNSDVPDAAERHDYYIGQALYEELKGQQDG